MQQLVKVILLPLLALAFGAGSVLAAPTKSKPSNSGTTQRTSTKPPAAPAKPKAKAPTKTAPKASTPTRTYIAGGKDGPCACSKGKSCRDGAGKRYCVESTGRKRIIG